MFGIRTNHQDWSLPSTYRQAGFAQCLNNDVRRQRAADPENRKAEHLGPRDQAKYSGFAGLGVVVAGQECKRDHAGNRQNQTDHLTPDMHSAESPGKKAEVQDDKGQQPFFRLMELGPALCGTAEGRERGQPSRELRVSEALQQ